MEGSDMWDRESAAPPLTGFLHVFQLDVDVAADAQWQRGLAPGDHGGVEDTQGAVPHRLPGFSQQFQGDGVRRHVTHLQNQQKHVQRTLKKFNLVLFNLSHLFFL